MSPTILLSKTATPYLGSGLAFLGQQAPDCGRRGAAAHDGAVVGLMIWDMRRVTQDDVRQNVAKLGIAIAEQTTRSVQSVDLSLAEIRKDIASEGSTRRSGSKQSCEAHPNTPRCAKKMRRCRSPKRSPSSTATAGC